MNSRFFILIHAAVLLSFASTPCDKCRVHGAEGGRSKIVTRWAKDVSNSSVLPEYPRPQMVRGDWLNLNGTWDLSISATQKSAPDTFPDNILVPFPLESHLSGVEQRLLPSQTAWYRREFEVDSKWNEKILLHFGAVDWHATVWINGQLAGEHKGGYDPFSFDITDLVNAGESNEIVVGVTDPTDSGTQPRGKQTRSPEGIWYTPISGIWQTVWLEPVPKSFIKGVRIVPNHEDSIVTLDADVEDAEAGALIRVAIKSGGEVVSTKEQPVGTPLSLNIESAHAWSPRDPFLYDLEVQLVSEGQTVDAVSSYFGMRSIQLGADRNGLQRILFNGTPLFQFGPLDQGYWPDGLYTAPTDEALRSDIDLAKRLGFNMVRKHVKVEPARWYYWCDRLGLLVWQDMPSGGENVTWPADGTQMHRTEESAAQYRAELRALVDALRNSPSIVVWVPFNEGWGQFDTESVTAWLKKYDPKRLVISASGGNDFGCGDIKDDHFYPGPGAPPAEENRAAVLGEFGGLGFPVANHTWQDEQNWGYRSFETKEQLTTAYVDLIAKLRPLIESHLSAAVYTQTTDVEIEVNGLTTYDREVLKVDEQAVRSANVALFQSLPPRTEAENVSTCVLAWWRFEDGKAGKSVSDLTRQMGAIAARDFSGHNNHLFAFSPNHAPAVSDDVPRRPFGLTEAKNRLCLDDSQRPGDGASSRDLYTNAEVARTHMDDVNRYPFADVTVEASFRLSESPNEQTVLTKEEDHGGTMVPLFQLGTFGKPAAIGVEFVDQAGETVAIRTDVPAESDRWSHVAFTCDGEIAKLYIARDDAAQDYVLAGEASTQGSLVRRGGTWLVGRGCESGKMGRDFLGLIDEVRISTKALGVSQFLFGSTNQTMNDKAKDNE